MTIYKNISLDNVRYNIHKNYFEMVRKGNTLLQI
jgi:hypothetical protein